jgi:DNA-binding NarL/FixJ family response regulator
LIVAGYASVRAGLHALLAAEPDLDVRGDAPASGDALARLLPALRPDVVLLDTTGGEGSAEPVARVLDALPAALLVPPALVVLGDAPTRDLPRLQRAALPGWGYLLREADGPQIAGAVRAAAAGLVALDPGLPFAVATPDAARPGADKDGGGGEEAFPGDALTPRETEVLQLMTEGLPNKIIASRLGISLHTAKFHVAQILGKLGATSRTEAVTMGARRGYVIL